MTEILLLHSALGLRPGVHAFAAELRAAGHTVHTPDFYEGAVFDDLDAGIAHRDALGFEQMLRTTTAAADAAPGAHVFAGFSLGGWFAHHLARTRPGATGLLLLHEGEPEPEHPWPEGVACQIHGMEDDPWLEVEALRALEQETGGELFLYPGSAHLFTDPHLAEYDAAATALVLERSKAFLAGL
jgi:dienelactone hydrolase